MTNSDAYLNNISNSTISGTKHLSNIDTRLGNLEAHLARINTQSVVANAIAYLTSGHATDEEAKTLRTFIRKQLNLSKG